MDLTLLILVIVLLACCVAPMWLMRRRRAHKDGASQGAGQKTDTSADRQR
jgi:hypothetical protein